MPSPLATSRSALGPRLAIGVSLALFIVRSVLGFALASPLFWTAVVMVLVGIVAVHRAERLETAAALAAEPTPRDGALYRAVVGGFVRGDYGPVEFEVRLGRVMELWFEQKSHQPGFSHWDPVEVDGTWRFTEGLDLVREPASTEDWARSAAWSAQEASRRAREAQVGCSYHGVGFHPKTAQRLEAAFRTPAHQLGLRAATARPSLPKADAAAYHALLPTRKTRRDEPETATHADDPDGRSDHGGCACGACGPACSEARLSLDRSSRRALRWAP